MNRLAYFGRSSRLISQIAEHELEAVESNSLVQTYKEHQSAIYTMLEISTPVIDEYSDNGSYKKS